MIRMVPSLLVATAVLNAVERHLRSELFGKPLSEEFCVEAYSNGREQGFLLRANCCKGCIAFAENRHSENIVVYHSSDGTSFDTTGNLPDEQTYKAGKMFLPGRYDRAAEFIVRQMRLMTGDEKAAKPLRTVDSMRHAIVTRTSGRRIR